MIALVGGAIGVAYAVDPAVAGGILLGTLIVGGVALEVVFMLTLWYGSFRLESVNGPKNDWDDEF